MTTELFEEYITTCDLELLNVHLKKTEAVNTLDLKKLQEKSQSIVTLRDAMQYSFLRKDYTRVNSIFKLIQEKFYTNAKF